eukprot:6185298-Pleurochrysis_carterae.AAC.1
MHGKTLIADSWFGSVACELELFRNDLFSIMNVKTGSKRGTRSRSFSTWSARLTVSPPKLSSCAANGAARRTKKNFYGRHYARGHRARCRP